MDRTKFKASLITMKETDVYSMEQIRSGVSHCIDATEDGKKFRGHRNILICAEECMELGQEFTKALRGKLDSDGLLEELADVAISVLAAQEVFRISDNDLQRAITIKLQEFKEKQISNDIF